MRNHSSFMVNIDKAILGSQKRIMIVEDHPIVREGIVSLIENETEIRVCAQVDDAKSVKQKVIEEEPDLIMMDLVLGGNDGLELIKELKVQFKDIKILIFSMREESIYAERAIKAGAMGYIMKQEGAARIIDGIKSVLSEQIFISHGVSACFMQRSLRKQGKASKQGLEALSNRELRVFQIIGKGHTTRTIAKQLKISVKTVESHRENIKNKLNLDNSTALVRAAALWVEEQHR